MTFKKIIIVVVTYQGDPEHSVYVCRSQNEARGVVLDICNAECDETATTLRNKVNEILVALDAHKDVTAVFRHLEDCAIDTLLVSTIEVF